MKDNKYQKRLRKQFEEIKRNNESLMDWKKAVEKDKQQLSVSFIRQFRDYLLPSPFYTDNIMQKNAFRELGNSFYSIVFYLVEGGKFDDDFINEFCIKVVSRKVTEEQKKFFEEMQKSLWGVLARKQNLSKKIIDRNCELFHWEELREKIASGSLELDILDESRFLKNYMKTLQLEKDKLRNDYRDSKKDY